MTIVPISHVPVIDVEALLDRAFGSDRHGRTAYRLRAGVAQIAALSFAALDASGGLVATIQCWPVTFHGDDGACVPMILVGPVAVDPALQGGGVGKALTHRMLDTARASDLPGAHALMLIGDPEYYGRFFGFDARRTAGWRLPGPFEPRRLLALGDAVPDGTGEVRPRT